MQNVEQSVIPAQAGIQKKSKLRLDSRFHGNDSIERNEP